MGGRSAERAVSLSSGAQVSAALTSAGFDVVEIDTGDDEFVVALAGAGADVAFICLHGRLGEDGTVQGLCELLELPYVGSGVLASALAIDKVKSKLFFEVAGLASPEYAVLERGELFEVDALVAALGAKTVVKPANEGSSVGMTIVHQAGELAEAIETAFRYDRFVLVERFIAGAEVTVAVIGNEDLVALPTLEIVPTNEFYDYDSKYVPGMSRHIIPARVSEDARQECQRLAIEAHKVLGCRGISRADTIVEEDGSVWLLEVNTIPGMTATSLVPDAARAAGIEFPELCRMLVEFALEPTR
ncbi:MAG: D-alanine--D-alanine ligase [Coriobacteriia bacterium]|nr:D-alanine--D-alanine ligase [Coriobacteriia bacterium]